MRSLKLAEGRSFTGEAEAMTKCLRITGCIFMSYDYIKPIKMSICFHCKSLAYNVLLKKKDPERINRVHQGTTLLTCSILVYNIIIIG